jgi:hypothetical protein
VRPLVVVGVNPAVDRGLRRLKRLERGDVVQQLGRSVLWNRLIFPVVVGDLGLV